jgi:hypothetical protein
VSNRGCGITPPSIQKISTSWRAAWKTLTTDGVAHQIEERRQLDPLGQRVDENGAVVAAARQRQLHQAELGVIGPLAQKLGIDGDIGLGRGLGAEGRKRVGRGNGLHPASLGGQFAACGSHIARPAERKARPDG